MARKLRARRYLRNIHIFKKNRLFMQRYFLQTFTDFPVLN